MKTIHWKSVEVELSKIKPTPSNYKIKTDEGLARFQHSATTYGIAGTVILNLDYTLIDGNTRFEDAKSKGYKKINASIPSRLLTPKEFKEFAAMYDYARAGEVDLMRIKKEIGTTKSFFKEWGLGDIPGVMENLAALDKADGKIVAAKAGVQKPDNQVVTRPVTLLFTSNENETFIAKAEALYSKYKVDNVTDLVYKIFTKKGLL